MMTKAQARHSELSVLLRKAREAHTATHVVLEDIEKQVGAAYNDALEEAQQKDTQPKETAEPVVAPKAVTAAIPAGYTRCRRCGTLIPVGGGFNMNALCMACDLTEKAMPPRP